MDTPRLFRGLGASNERAKGGYPRTRSCRLRASSFPSEADRICDSQAGCLTPASSHSWALKLSNEKHNTSTSNATSLFSCLCKPTVFNLATNQLSSTSDTTSELAPRACRQRPPVEVREGHALNDLRESVALRSAHIPTARHIIRTHGHVVIIA